jgi:S1-C subfamily serine protease
MDMLRLMATGCAAVILSACASMPTAALASSMPAPSAIPGQRAPFGVGVTEAVGEHGLKVVVVVAGSAAANAGISAGDILVSIDGEPVTVKGDVRRIMSARPEGSILPIRLIRNGAIKDVAACNCSIP